MEGGRGVESVPSVNQPEPAAPGRGLGRGREVEPPPVLKQAAPSASGSVPAVNKRKRPLMMRASTGDELSYLSEDDSSSSYEEVSDEETESSDEEISQEGSNSLDQVSDEEEDAAQPVNGGGNVLGLAGGDIVLRLRLRLWIRHD